MKTLDEITNDMIEVAKSTHDAMLNCLWDRLSLACGDEDWPDDAEVWCAVQIRLGLKREGSHAAYVPDFRVKGPFRASRQAWKATHHFKPCKVVLGPVRCGDLRAHNDRLREAEMQKLASA